VRGLHWALGVQGNIAAGRHVSPYSSVVVRGILDFRFGELRFRGFVSPQCKDFRMMPANHLYEETKMSVQSGTDV